MKFFTSATLLLASYSSVTATNSVFVPSRISFAGLAGRDPQDSKILLDALQHDGMISVTDVPLLYKMETLMSLPECIEETKEASEHTYSDGTRRTTLATHSVAGDMQTLNNPEIEACMTFDQTSPLFREAVADVTKAFATRLSSVLDTTEPILSNEEQSFSFADVVKLGEHLEHFHSYKASAETPSASSDSADTIEWHTDQGLALVFTPGLVNSQPSEGFYVKLKDGSTAMVQFEEQDDLVILLGDGIDQYVNAALKTSSLRSVPHALRMPATSEPRVWYGRMVLPPADAIHPIHQETFGDLRKSMIDKESEESLALGCSSTLQARQLEETSCGTDAFYCWHRCFNHTEEASPDACAEQELDLACINEERQLWTEDFHDPQFTPGCVDLETAENYTAPDNHTEHKGTDHPDDGEQTHSLGGDQTSSSVLMSISSNILAMVSLLTAIFVL